MLELVNSLTYGTIKFVTRSVPNVKDYDIFKVVLKQGLIKPYSWKAGFSINGCYAVNGYSTDAVLIFDYEDVKEKLTPVFYFPLAGHDWYKTSEYLVTSHLLTWEAELALLEGEAIPLDLCKK